MRGTRRFVVSILLVALVVVGLDGTLFLLGKKPRLGLDLQGGLSVVLTAPKGTRSDVLDETVNILRNRIDRAGVGEPQISREGGNNILIEIPGVRHPEELLKLVGQTAQLQFRRVQSVIAPSDPGFATATVSTTDDPNQAVTYPGIDGNKYKLDKATLKGDAIARWMYDALEEMDAGGRAPSDIDVYHGRKRTAISETGEQGFRTKSYADFGRSRTVVSADAEHPFRLMPNSPGS